MNPSHQTSDNRNAATGPQIDPGIYVRPVEPADRAGVRALFEQLSPQSRHRRFLSPKPTLSERELTYLTVVDHRWREALGAVDRRDGSIVAAAHYAGEPGRLGVADVAVVVADGWQRRGIGGTLSHALIARARVNGFRVLTATTMWENRPARTLLRRLGFHARASAGASIELELDL